MKVAIVTDAWRPQINGVVTTLSTTGTLLEQLGHDVRFVTPDHFKTIPCPTYPSIRLARNPIQGVRRALDAFEPDAIHIATEGPLGLTARHYCHAQRLNFTTSYHTRMAEYIRLRVPIPLAWSYGVLRRFHSRAVRTLVPTESLRQHLLRLGFCFLVFWSCGVVSSLFCFGVFVLFVGLCFFVLFLGCVVVVLFFV